MIGAAISPLFDKQVYRARAPLRLFCVPHAGGNSSLFRDWGQWLQGIAQVCPVQLPGRGARLTEPAYTNVPEAVEAIVEALESMCDWPFVLFGYSMGALIAFELARALEAQHRSPKMLIVAACPAPHVPRRQAPMWQLPADQFLQSLQKINGTPADLLSDPETMKLFLPSLRADFQLVETYLFAPGVTLGCPITAYAGVDDEDAPQEEMRLWTEHTRGGFMIETFPGNHFFIRMSEVRMLRSMERVLAYLG